MYPHVSRNPKKMTGDLTLVAKRMRPLLDTILLRRTFRSTYLDYDGTEETSDQYVPELRVHRACVNFTPVEKRMYNEALAVAKADVNFDFDDFRNAT